MNKLVDINKNAQIGKNLKIEAFSSIHENVIIGDNQKSQYSDMLNTQIFHILIKSIKTMIQ